MERAVSLCLMKLQNTATAGLENKHRCAFGRWCSCSYVNTLHVFIRLNKGFRKRVQWSNQNPTSLSVTNSQVSIQGIVSFLVALEDNSSQNCPNAGSWIRCRAGDSVGGSHGRLEGTRIRRGGNIHLTQAGKIVVWQNGGSWCSGRAVWCLPGS